MSSIACSICEQVAGRVAAPGGPIHDDGLWLVSHHTGPHTDPGELIVLLRRHAESLAELTAEEAAALGPVLRAAVAAVERVVKPERTYVASYSERVRHVHFFVLPRTRRCRPATSSRTCTARAGCGCVGPDWAAIPAPGARRGRLAAARRSGVAIALVMVA